MAIKRQSKIIRLRRRSFKKDNFWKGKRIIYEVKDKNHFKFLSFIFFLRKRKNIKLYDILTQLYKKAIPKSGNVVLI
ncbi:hypothetical protein CEQ16_14870 [Enterococcus faecalis]|nr:hypothetical protein CEQ16_14870 [Enterococcus faecalis]EGO8617451.1 hypothetical protein [Enterococcus faecalis]